MPKDLLNYVSLQKNLIGTCHLVKSQKSGALDVSSELDSCKKITDAYDKNPEIENLLLDDYFVEITKKYQQSVRDVVALAVQAGVPVPTFSSAIAYFDSYRAERLPANIIQAQRDYFGAHTYERVDKEGIFHYSWYHEE